MRCYKLAAHLVLSVSSILLLNAAAADSGGVLPKNASVSTQAPLFRSVELDVGDVQQLELSDGSKVTVELISLDEARCNLNRAVREARVRIRIDEDNVTLISGNYHLPVQVGRVQVDCPVTQGYMKKGEANKWGLGKDVRLRLWPAKSPWRAAGTFVYPVRQAWFASDTQMCNVPVFVDGGETPNPNKSVYYHSGLDFGGAEGMVDVVAATTGTVLTSGTDGESDRQIASMLPSRYDAVTIHGVDGWYYRYSHLKSIDPAVKVGARIPMGSKIGVLGKEGSSGGWSHLHFEAYNRQPSGEWGTEDAYAFAWEAYVNEYKPKVNAVARPHCFAAVGQKVTLDGSRSWSVGGSIMRYDWTFTQGGSATGPKPQQVYDTPGTYSEVLKVTDPAGRVDYDFAVVQIVDPDAPDRLPPTIHAVFAPTTGIRVGDPVTFKVRTFRCKGGCLENDEVWDFGDGSPPVAVRSDGNAVKHAEDGYAATVHRFDRPGDHLVSVRRTNQWGHTAIGRLHVRVEK